MNLTFKIRGQKSVERRLARVEDVVREAARQGVAKGILAIHETAVKSIKTQSMGRQYGGHIASKPGDPPNVDTGALVNAVDWNLDERDLFGEVGLKSVKNENGQDAKDYGVELEMGSTRIKPRPFMGPAVRKNQRKIERTFRKLKLRGLKRK